MEAEDLQPFLIVSPNFTKCLEHYIFSFFDRLIRHWNVTISLVLPRIKQLFRGDVRLHSFAQRIQEISKVPAANLSFRSILPSLIFQGQIL